MTAQMHDEFLYLGTEYSVVGISEAGIFDPAILGLYPVMASTACYRGYQAILGLSNSRLILDELNIRLCEDGEESQDREGPVIKGIKPTAAQDKFDEFNNHYKGLNYNLNYTGSVLLANGFIEELYEHMGFHPAWKYSTVIELVFDNGYLTAEYDCSERMAEIREMELKIRTDQGLNPMQSRINFEELFIRACERKNKGNGNK